MCFCLHPVTGLNLNFVSWRTCGLENFGQFCDIFEILIANKGSEKRIWIYSTDLENI